MVVSKRIFGSLPEERAVRRLMSRVTIAGRFRSGTVVEGVVGLDLRFFNAFE